MLICKKYNTPLEPIKEGIKGNQTYFCSQSKIYNSRSVQILLPALLVIQPVLLVVTQ